MSSPPETASATPQVVNTSRTSTGARERSFRPDIQGLRAIAVSLVVVYHLYPSALPGGFAGVDIFFVISGYLITGHLWRGCQKTGRLSLTDFWGRRARRLVPAAALVLAATWGASYLLLPSSQLANTAQQIRASALYFQNWQLASDAVNYLQQGSAASPVQHFWSLSVEEQFYLVWPLLFFAALLIARARAGGHEDSMATRTAVAHRAAFALTATLVVASLAYSVYDTATSPAQAYFVTTTRMWELGAGGLLALLPAGITERVARHGWLGWAGLAMIAASQFVLNGSTPFPGWIALLPVGGTLALIAGGSSRGRYSPWRLTSARPMTFLGDISYSVYLWHWPIIVFWTAWRGHGPGLPDGIFIIVVSIALAWLTKVTVEDRIRLAPFFARHKWRSVSTALAAVVPVALVTGFLVSQPVPWDGKLGPGYPGAKVLAARLSDVPVKPVLPPPDDVAEPGYWAEGCLDGEHVAVPKTCTFGDTKHPTLKVVLAGDSMAGNWWAPLDTIATQEHWELITEVHATCPWTATQLYDPVNKGAYPTCYQWGVNVLHDLTTTIRPDVVIATGLAGQPTLAYPVDSPQSRADLGAGMATYWKDLEAHGIPVIGIQETPNMSEDVPACVAKYGASAASCSVPRSAALPANPPTSDAARDLDGTVPVIDMNSLICAPATCSPVVGNVLVYMDGHHLTQSFAATLSPYLKDRLLPVVKQVVRTAATK
ncbi:MAG TPA: acyltransferase family protein [Trebonia sp.]|jgi:peptidoglycan/LPS O-acetylase OafA/YrhL|nr:acyltransferase family protein [Trebonia sp.]